MNYDRFFARIQELHHGWDGCDAPRPAASAIDRAKMILGLLCLLQPCYITADAEGGVAIMFYGEGDKRAYVCCANDGDDYLHVYAYSGGSSTMDISLFEDLDQLEVFIFNSLYTSEL